MERIVMNPYKNVSVMRDQEVPSERIEYMKSQVAEIELLEQENKRLSHLTTVLIDHIWKSSDKEVPLRDIDRQMKLFDEENGT
jgi:uncharacterized protein YpiB (UPF0302 family)